MLIIFEAVAITLWLTKDNIFYLFNFSYIGLSISLGIFLFIKKYKHARRIVQLLVGLYMLIYLGIICNENMQIEGFWYYLFTGVFEAATIHYTVAKIFGPLLFGRGWCGYACWTAMVLDFLPYKSPSQFLTSLHHNQERISNGLDTLHLRFHWYLLPHCSLLRLAISNGLCSGHLLSAISLIMLWALHSHLRLRITEHFVNIYVPSLYF